jgi:23S rRNA (guanosine2251-2'-O)-methyltransferase
MKEWVIGRNPVYEVLRARRRQVFRLVLAQGIRSEGQLPRIIEMARERRLRIEEASRDGLDPLGYNHQGVALDCSSYPYAALEDLIFNSQSKGEPPFFLLLDLIQDPQNLATLLRTAETMGIHGVVIPSSQAAQITPTVVHASSGASEHLLIAQYNLVQAMERFKKMDIWVYGLDEDERSRTPDQLRLTGGIALVVGNEGSGLRELVRKSCDELMKLPMFGKIESLNAAAAGSIALYLARQARKPQ